MEHFELSASQKHVASTHGILSCIESYAICEIFELGFSVDRTRLLASIGVLAARHKALRAKFSADYQSLVCLPYEATDFSSAIKIAKLDMIDASSWDSSLSRLRTDIENEPFNPPQDFLFSLTIVEAPGRNALIICMHHGVFDGWSFQRFVQELLKTYFEYKTQKDRPRDSARESTDELMLVLNKEQLQISDLSRLEFWRHALAPLKLRPAQCQVDTAGPYRSTVVRLQGAVSDRVREITDANHIPLAATFLDASIAAMEQYIDLKGDGLSTVQLNRDSTKELSAYGEFAQWAPVPVQALELRAAQASSLERQRQLWADVIKAGELRLPYWWLVAQFDPELISSRYGLTRSLFNFVPTHNRLDRAGELARWRNDPVSTPVWAIPDFYIHVVDILTEIQIIYRVNRHVESEMPTDELLASLQSSITRSCDEYVRSEVRDA